MKTWTSLLCTGLIAAAISSVPTPSSAQVGFSQLTSGPLPVTLVYPTASPGTVQTMGPFQLEVAVDAPPLAKRHPLVVISHGTGGSALADHALAAALAKAGFVVAQPLHRGDNHKDMSLSGPESFRRRPGEVTELIDSLAQDPTWGPRLDLSRVGVHGMSAGGVTALSLAGAQWRLLNLVQHCLDHDPEDEGFCYQGAAAPDRRAARRQQTERVRGVPESFLPKSMTTLEGGMTPTAAQPDPRPDRRIAAVTVAVPVAAIFSSESLARITVPVGVVSASDDQVLLPRFHSGYLLSHCTRCTLLAEMTSAGHFDVLWPWPESIAREVAAGQVRGGEPMPGFDARQRDAAHAKLVAFYLQHLGSPR